MKKTQIIEAWRSEEYYLNMSEEERAALPAHPAGPTSVEDEILRSVTGGCGQWIDPRSSGYCSPCGTTQCY